jgi:hypothetical protein
MGTLWVSMLPTARPPDSIGWRNWTAWAPLFTLVVRWRRQHFVSYTGGCPPRPTSPAMGHLPGQALPGFDARTTRAVVLGRIKAPTVTLFSIAKK